MTPNERTNLIFVLYELLSVIESKCGGARYLSDFKDKLSLPDRGVYFFFEPGETRFESFSGDRVVRVGTHALKTDNRSTLWGRLRQHRGVLSGGHPGGGNHRGSVFRKHIGAALIKQKSFPVNCSYHWGKGSSSTKEIQEQEYPIEIAVSDHIRKMPFIWIEVNDLPGPNSFRAYIERNCIALLSNANKEKIDEQSIEWLGNHTENLSIINSGLWNVNHVYDDHDPDFLNIFSEYISRQK